MNNCSTTTQRCAGKSKPAGPPFLPPVDPGPNDLGHMLLRKVLVVDDEADLADLAAVLLNAHGLEAITASSAKDAMQILATESDIDAIISDIVMPGMTGLELADVIREMYPHIKIVLTSGYTPPGQLAKRERPYLFAAKPYQIETLLQLLRS